MIRVQDKPSLLREVIDLAIDAEQELRAFNYEGEITDHLSEKVDDAKSIINQANDALFLMERIYDEFGQALEEDTEISAASFLNFFTEQLHYLEPLKDHCKRARKA